QTFAHAAEGCFEKRTGGEDFMRVVFLLRFARVRFFTLCKYLPEHEELPATNEPIANSDHCLDAVAAFVEFLSEPANVHVERTSIPIVTVTPDTIQQLLARHHAVRAAREYRQEREFLVRQFYLGAVANDPDV